MDWVAIKDAVVATAKSRLGKFLDQNKDAADFLRERAERFAKLTVAWGGASTEEERSSFANDMSIVRISIDNEIASVAVAAAAETRALFKSILSTALETLARSLPGLLGAL